MSNVRQAELVAASGSLPVVRPGGRARSGLALPAAWSACSGSLAFFADDRADQPVPGSGIVHLALAVRVRPGLAGRR
jgi:hypothetical protein